jgi:predicted Zn-dependent peptidase
LSSEDFRLALEEKDVVFNASVNMSNTILGGSAPDSDLDVMMRALLAFLNEREYDEEAFEYYKSCTEASLDMSRGTVRDRIVAIDSLMCPEYEYSSLKSQGKITEEFSEKVERFWQNQSGKTNDGVLVLVGDVDEIKLKKFLQSYVGQFRTTDKVYPRLNVTYQPVSGAIAYTFKGNSNSVDVALSARLPLTAENYMASNIAASILKQMISRAIDGTGMYLRLVHDCRIYPQERFNMMITLEEADPYGFAHDVQLTGASSALAILRNVLDDLPEIELNDEDLVKHKEVLKGQISIKLSDPQYWVQAIARRYLDGKDFTTSYDSRIDAITVDKVKSILASLSETSRVEYIIEK